MTDDVSSASHAAAQEKAGQDKIAQDKTARRIAQTLAKYRAAPAPGVLRAALAQGLDAAALATPDGLARVHAELKALKVERRALRRLENLLLSALGHAAGEENDDED
jgi:hypothetical protein